MKYILSALFILISFPLPAQKQIKEKDVHFNDSIYYYKNKPVKGAYKVKRNKPNNHFSEIATYKNGIKEGRAKILWFNKLEEEGYYMNNMREGVWKTYYHFNGKLNKISKYSNNIKEDLEIVYNHSSEDSLFYVNGELDGIQTNNDKYKGRTEISYDKGTIIASFRHTTKGRLEEECKYIGNNQLIHYYIYLKNK